MLRWYRERARLRRETRKCAEWLMSDMYEEIVLTWKRLGLYKQHGPRERQRQKALRAEKQKMLERKAKKGR